MDATLIIRGGLVLDAAHFLGPADILVRNGRIIEIGPPGCAAPEGAEISSGAAAAAPGLVNAHTHGHGNLAKGMGDRWTLELLLTAAPWITGDRSLEDNAICRPSSARSRWCMKGCTACYDLSFEWPLPTAEGLALAAQAYADVGMRAVIAPMVADRSFYEAIPGLIEAMPPALQTRVAELRLPPAEATLAGIRAAFAAWPFDREQVRPAVAPTIPHHCSDEFILGCAELARELDVGLHSHVAESKVQAVAGIRRLWPDARPRISMRWACSGRTSRSRTGFGSTMTTWPGSAATAPRSRTTPAATCGSGGGLADSRAMLDRGVNLGIGTDGANCSDNQNMYEAMRLRLVRLQGARTRSGAAGSPPARRRWRRPRAAPARWGSRAASAGWRRATRPTSSCSTSTTRTGCR